MVTSLAMDLPDRFLLLRFGAPGCQHWSHPEFFARHHLGFAGDLYFELYLSGVPRTGINVLVQDGTLKAALWPQGAPQTALYWDNEAEAVLTRLSSRAVRRVGTDRIRVDPFVLLESSTAAEQIAGFVYVRECGAVREVLHSSGDLEYHLL